MLVGQSVPVGLQVPQTALPWRVSGHARTATKINSRGRKVRPQVVQFLALSPCMMGAIDKDMSHIMACAGAGNKPLCVTIEPLAAPLRHIGAINGCVVRVSVWVGWLSHK